jgi:hypothetical protein
MKIEQRTAGGLKSPSRGRNANGRAMAASLHVGWGDPKVKANRRRGP